MGSSSHEETKAVNRSAASSRRCIKVFRPPCYLVAPGVLSLHQGKPDRHTDLLIDPDAFIVAQSGDCSPASYG